MEDWYGITQALMRANGGAVLLDHFKNVREIVTNLIPSHDWDAWKFSCANDWDSASVRENYMKYPF